MTMSPALLQAAVQPAAKAVSVPHTADAAKLMKAAQDFETMAIGALLQPMFDTVQTAGSAFGGGAGEEAWKPMLVQEYAKQLSRHGGLGLAKPVYEAMLRMQEGPKK